MTWLGGSAVSDGGLRAKLAERRQRRREALEAVARSGAFTEYGLRLRMAATEEELEELRTRNLLANEMSYPGATVGDGPVAGCDLSPGT